MRYSRAVAFESLRQALDLHGLLASDDPWCEAIRHDGRVAGASADPLRNLDDHQAGRGGHRASPGPEPAPEHGGEPGGCLPEDRGQQPKRRATFGLNRHFL